MNHKGTEGTEREENSRGAFTCIQVILLRYQYTRPLFGDSSLLFLPITYYPLPITYYPLSIILTSSPICKILPASDGGTRVLTLTR
jgi:hypothetical protein